MNNNWEYEPIVWQMMAIKIEWFICDVHFWWEMGWVNPGNVPACVIRPNPSWLTSQEEKTGICSYRPAALSQILQDAPHTKMSLIETNHFIFLW